MANYRRRKHYRRRGRRSSRRNGSKYSMQSRRVFAPRRSLLGNSRVVKLKYCETTQIPVDLIGLPGLVAFNILNIQDPNFSSGGHQPRGYDQLESLWNRYNVLGARITVNFMPSNTQHSVIQYIQTTSLTPLTLVNPVDALEDRQVVSRPFAPGGGAVNGVLFSNFSTKRFFDKADVVDDHHLGGFTGGAPPPVGVYWVVSNSPTHAGVTGLQPTDIVVNIEYIVLYSAPKNPLAS